MKTAEIIKLLEELSEQWKIKAEQSEALMKSASRVEESAARAHDMLFFAAARYGVETALNLLRARERTRKKAR